MDIDAYIEKLLNKAEVLGSDVHKLEVYEAISKSNTYSHIYAIMYKNNTIDVLIPSDVKRICLGYRWGINSVMGELMDAKREHGLKKLRVIGGSNLDIARAMFSDMQYIDEIDVTMLDTSNIKNMGGMFRLTRSCKRHINGLERLDTSKAESMEEMFFRNELDINKEDLIKLINNSKIANKHNIDWKNYLGYLNEWRIVI